MLDGEVLVAFRDSMTAKDLLYYQFGNAEAIRRVAGNRYLVAVGAALVLITSVPRNYDQTYIGEVPWWPVIPLLFSFVSGSFLFWVLNRGFIKDAEGEPARSKYWMFLGLFWMTAPVAWLYGIPVERFMDGRGGGGGEFVVAGNRGGMACSVDDASDERGLPDTLGTSGRMGAARSLSGGGDRFVLYGIW